MWLRRSLKISIVAVGIVGLPAQATVLIFDTGETNCFTFVADCLDYGDRVSAAMDSNGFFYEEGSGFTPNVVADYLPSRGSFSLYDFTYAIAPGLGHQEFNVPGEVVLTADSGGYIVILNGFEVSASVSVPNPETTIRVLDGSDAVLFQDVFTAEPSGIYVYDFGFFPLSSDVIRIEVNNFGDLALSNVDFEQFILPVPAAAWLFGSAIGLLGWLRRKGT